MKQPNGVASLFIILQVTLLTCGFSSLDFEDDFQHFDKREVEPDYPISDYLENCGMTHEIKMKPFKFATPYFGQKQYPNINCSWNFVGTENCPLSLSCSKLDLRPNKDCKKEFLEISDGIGGRQRYCGTTKFTHRLQASDKSRDLFVQLQTMTVDSSKFDRVFNGFLCQVDCGKGNDQKLKYDDSFHKVESRCFCGLKNEDDRIVNGEDASMNEFPWLVAIVQAGTRVPICGGSIINDRYILSAAHCFSFDPKPVPGDIEVLAHAHTLDFSLKSDWVDAELGVKGSIRGSGYNLLQVTDDQEKTERYKVVEIINHPLFTTKYDYDVALLKLSRRIQFNHANAPVPICLPKSGDYNQTFEGRVPVVAGWGMPSQDAGATTRILQKLSVPIIPLKKCQQWIKNNNLTQRMLCAGYEEGRKDACMGDSGGPLIIPDDSKSKRRQWTQIGIVSWGIGCARKQRPGLYSKLTELVQWVKKHSATGIWCSQ